MLGGLVSFVHLSQPLKEEEEEEEEANFEIWGAWELQLSRVWVF